MTQYKTCTKCGQTFPATTEYFHKHIFGLHPRCKQCRSEERRERYEADSEVEREQMRRYAKEHSKEAVERMTIWKKQNPERLTEHNRKYRQNHKEQGRVNVTNRHARLAKAKGKHTAEDILQLYKEQGGKCAYCGIYLGNKYHVDHVVPISRGGSNSPDNLALACQHCNDSKGAKLLSEWFN